MLPTEVAPRALIGASGPAVRTGLIQPTPALRRRGHGTAKQQQFLGQCRLAGIQMRDDRKRPPAQNLVRQGTHQSVLAGGHRASGPRVADGECARPGRCQPRVRLGDLACIDTATEPSDRTGRAVTPSAARA
jgi:hypothetical protein